ncbi:hypothetical protein [Nocardia sp. NPDC051832]|uniref:hypothetical protein n=1 Tax=Nocardia sp. NPDC051832 TaxID=3155673 RepID=UPI00342F1B56
MPVTVRVGAVHLGWDVVSVAAGGGGVPIRPVQVEGTYTPPAYLLADAQGRLHTAGVEQARPDLGRAIADVRDILGHPQIVVAGATWPAELVFRARLYNPLAAIGKHLRGKPDVVALPYPDPWPDEKVDIYAELVEQLDVTVEPLPESVALSGYVRALGLVRRPDERDPRGIGATGVYSDGRTMLVVAVHGDDEMPTESVDVPVDAEAMRDARSADNVVIEVMAAARSIGADTSTVLLCGNVCFNDALRLAFQNHLGHRLQVADHPMHALVLGATHLLVTDNESGEPVSSGRHAEPAAPPPVRRDIPAPPATTQSGAPVVTYGAGYPTTPPVDAPTTRVTREEMAQQPPDASEVGSRFTRPPVTPSPAGPRSPYPPPPSRGAREPWGDPVHSDEDDETEHPQRKSKLWGKTKGKLFGAGAALGGLMLAAAGVPAAGDTTLADCPRTPYILNEQPPGIATANERPIGEQVCEQSGIDHLRYVIPGPKDGIDPGPPVEI